VLVWAFSYPEYKKRGGESPIGAFSCMGNRTWRTQEDVNQLFHLSEMCAFKTHAVTIAFPAPCFSNTALELLTRIPPSDPDYDSLSPFLDVPTKGKYLFPHNFPRFFHK
jgi:hypothetical protein